MSGSGELGMIERRVEVPPYSFWERRVGRGTPVVLVHGLSGSSNWWRHNIDALAQEHEVVAIDLVGFGRNRRFRDPGHLPLSFDDAAAMLARWLDSFEEPVHLVGHSMGGQISTLVAALRPDRVRSLVLVNSTGLPFALDPRPHLRSVYPPPPNLLSFSRVVTFDFLRAGPTAVALAAARVITGNAREAMTHVHVPTLIIWGARDPLVPRGYGDQLRSSIEGAELTVIPEAGHVTMWETPEAFNERVVEFLDSVEQAGAPAVSQHEASTPGAPAASRHETSTPGAPAASRHETSVFNWGVSGVDDGLVWRASSSDPDVILVHGLGVQSGYFRPLARALFARGVAALAPDLPGFGESERLPVDAPHHAERLIALHERLGLRTRTWIGHSTGCQVVERVAALRPDLVQRAIFVSPIWSRRPHLFARLLSKLPGDAVLEPWGLLVAAASSYWNAGAQRLLALAREYVPDAQRPRVLPRGSIVVAGEHDPFSEWELFAEYGAAEVIRLGGAHGVHYSHPEELAEVIKRRADL